MRKDDAELLRGIQKNTKSAMKALDTLSNKVYDDDLALQLSRQNLKYSEIYNKATNSLVEGNAEGYRPRAISERMMVGGIQANALFNNSTSHIAEMVIQGSNRGITEMCKSVNRHENARNAYVEIAQELMDFEEKNIAQLKKYL
jgi:hypothetical protein